MTTTDQSPRTGDPNNQVATMKESETAPSVDDIMTAVRRAAGQTAIEDPPEDGPGASGTAGWPRPAFFTPPAPDVSRGAYEAQELLQYRDRAFLTNAYRALLKRDPDPGGLENYLQILRSRPESKTAILAALSVSPEGRAKNVKVRGLGWAKARFRLQNIPAAGKLFRLLFSLSDPRGYKRALAIQEDRLGERTEELGRALDQMAAAVQTRLDAKMDKAAMDQKANVWDLDLKADRSDLAQKADVQDMDRYLRSVGHVLDMLLDMRTREAPKPTGPETPAPETPETPDSLQANEGYPAGGLDELYLAFEDAFRGPGLTVQRRMEMYLPGIGEVISLVAPPNAAPGFPAGCRVADLGCGRGEFLELLARSGIPAMGVDSNRFMVQNAAEKGLHVQQADLFVFLDALPAECLAVVSAFHVVEHLPFERQLLLIDQARRVLAPGGLLLLETPNPCNLLASAVDFHRDPTHLRPIHPDTLLFLARARGFARAGVFFPEEPPRGAPELKNAENKSFLELQDYVRVARDYALLAYKP